MDITDQNFVGNETVYGTQEDSHLVMSEKVQSLAGSIYQEFERMIARYDEDVVKTLMPLLVNVLECLDAAYQQNQEHDVELELLKEDNEQLVTQYEREKAARKVAEQKILEFEDAAEGEKKELVTRLESLESIVRLLELKHKNSLEHAGRLEERESDLKKEFAKLHERYTELFKTHMDYMERTKILLSGQQLANEKAEMGRLNVNRVNMARSSGPISFGFASLESAEIVDSVPSSPISSSRSTPSDTDPREKETLLPVENQEVSNTTTETKEDAVSPTSPVSSLPLNNNSRMQTKKEHRSGNTLYEELTFQEADIEDDSEVTGSWVHPGEYASSGMGKEVENLIMENNELLATKNALNVVKDDLIVKVDELTGELEMLHEEILSLKVSRSKLKERVSELEDELKKVKEAHEAKIEAGEDSSDVPMAQRKRFTRVEMARVLMERNQYKERFMELQDAIRWTEMIRASKSEEFDKKRNRGIWNFFNNLFNSSDRPPRPMGQSGYRYSGGSTDGLPMLKGVARPGQETETELGTIPEKLPFRRATDKREPYRSLKAHVRKEDGRLHAYGWSLPGKITPATKGSASGVPVPVPVYCRPLADSSPGMNIWCAAAVASSEATKLDDRDLDGAKEFQSSQVWICSITHKAGIVTIVDANNPAEILNAFNVCNSKILCITSVPPANGSISYASVKCNTPINENVEIVPDNDEPPTIQTEGAREMEEWNKEQSNKGKIYFIKEDVKEVVQQPDNGEEMLEDESKSEMEEKEPISSKQETMWIGTENGWIYVHSAIADCEKCLQSIKLKDAVMSIVHLNDQVVAALACGMMAIFRRNSGGEWDLSQYHLLQVGLPEHAVWCLTVVHDKIWCGYRNRVFILDPVGLKFVDTFEAHPRPEICVRQMAWSGAGVWISLRSDSTLRLYHAETYKHLQDIDIEPYVSKVLGTGKFGFTMVRIASMLVSSYRLWVGTRNGVIISVPLSSTEEQSEKNSNETKEAVESPVENKMEKPFSECVPYCSMSNAQLSFHGHRSYVKFFVAVPSSAGFTTPTSKPSTPTSSPVSTKPSNNMLVMSGGEGYIDFRIEEDGDIIKESYDGGGQDEDGKSIVSHLIVWQVSTPLS